MKHIKQDVNREKDEVIKKILDLLVFALVLLPTIGGHTLSMFLLRHVKSQMMTFSIPTQFVIGTFLAMLLFAEQPRPGFWLGAALVLAGVVLGILPKQKP